MNKSPTWISVFIPAEADAFESVNDVFFELGSTGTEECPNGIRAYFAGPQLPPSAVSFLKGYLEGIRALGLTVGDPVTNEVPVQDWAEKWSEGFKPVRVTDRIVVKPPWESWKTTEKETAIDAENNVIIDIYPRMAFGTGTHETTQLCLILAEKYLRPRWRVLDIGTGSAILAIAAAKLGADFVLALDNDEAAIVNAAENVKMNLVEERVRVELGTIGLLVDENRDSGTVDRPSKDDLSDKHLRDSKWNAGHRIPISGGFDFVIANIDKPTLIEVIPRIGPLMHACGLLVLSGILDVEQERMQTVLQENGWRVTDVLSRGEWVGLVGCLDKCRRC